jgi:cytoskeletal protein CcmA (bactofilin family)
MVLRDSYGKTAVALLVAAATLAVPAAAWANAGAHDADVISVGAGTTHDGNLYAFGSEVRIDGLVTGDVVGAGQTVRIGPTGRVQGDVLAAAYAVQVEGTVDGDVRGAAFMVDVGSAAKVGGEVAAAAYSVDERAGGRIGSDVLAAAYQLVVDGEVGHDVRFAGAALVINGNVGGDVDAVVAGSNTQASRPFVPDFGATALPVPRITANPGLTVGSTATIAGTLTYTSTTEAAIPATATAGAVTFNQVAPRRTDKPAPEPTPWWATALRDFVALAIVGLLLLWLAPRIIHPAVAALRGRPLPAIGYGVVAAVGDLAALVALIIAFILVLVVIGLLTLGGQLAVPTIGLFVILAALLTFGFVLLMLVGTIVSAQCLGQLLLRVREDSGLGRRLAALLVGAAILAVLIALPAGLGALAGLVIGLFGVGGLLLAWLAHRQPAQRGPGADLPTATPLPGQA